jgi:hypothetical protein
LILGRAGNGICGSDSDGMGSGGMGIFRLRLKPGILTVGKAGNGICGSDSDGMGSTGNGSLKLHPLAMLLCTHEF